MRSYPCKIISVPPSCCSRQNSSWFWWSGEPKICTCSFVHNSFINMSSVNYEHSSFIVVFNIRIVGRGTSKYSSDFNSVGFIVEICFFFLGKSAVEIPIQSEFQFSWLEDVFISQIIGRGNSQYRPSFSSVGFIAVICFYFWDNRPWEFQIQAGHEFSWISRCNLFFFLR